MSSTQAIDCRTSIQTGFRRTRSIPSSMKKTGRPYPTSRRRVRGVHRGTIRSMGWTGNARPWRFPVGTSSLGGGEAAVPMKVWRWGDVKKPLGLSENYLARGGRATAYPTRAPGSTSQRRILRGMPEYGLTVCRPGMGSKGRTRPLRIRRSTWRRRNRLTRGCTRSRRRSHLPGLTPFEFWRPREVSISSSIGRREYPADSPGALTLVRRHQRVIASGMVSFRALLTRRSCRSPTKLTRRTGHKVLGDGGTTRPGHRSTRKHPQFRPSGQ